MVGSSARPLTERHLSLRLLRIRQLPQRAVAEDNQPGARPPRRMWRRPPGLEMPSPKPGPLARASDVLKLACPLSSWNGLLTAIPTSRRSMVPRRSLVWVNREGQPCHHAVWSRTSSCSAAGSGGGLVHRGRAGQRHGVGGHQLTNLLRHKRLLLLGFHRTTGGGPSRAGFRDARPAPMALDHCKAGNTCAPTMRRRLSSSPGWM
jgi:hypothetical protein